MVTRRQVLALMGGAGATVGLGTWSGILRERIAAGSAAPGRALVVVQLGGGNDGLNTVIPSDGRYHDLRPSLAIADGDAVRVGGPAASALHPALAPLVARWEAGRVAVVHGLGYEHAGRSHFECSQHWWDGSDPHHPTTTGWLGRWLDATEGADPNPLRAIALGGGSPALRAERAVSTVVLRPQAFRVIAPRGSDADALASAFTATASPVSAESVLAAAQGAVTSAMHSVDALAPVLGVAQRGDGLADSLALAGDLLTRGLGVEVITVGRGGFDTHAAQADDHARLLADLASGLGELWSTLEAGGIADRVLVVTTSEFGRRVAENGSGGTDHGLAGCQLVMGPGVHGSIVGDVDLHHLSNGDLAAGLDPRALYATALRWLGGPVDEVVGAQPDLGVITS